MSRDRIIRLYVENTTLRNRAFLLLEYLSNRLIPEAVDPKMVQNTPGSLFEFVVQQWFEMNENIVRNATELLIKRDCNLQNLPLG